MKTQEEWSQLFETVIGREPTEIELLAAEQSHFNPQSIVSISEGRVFSENLSLSEQKEESKVFLEAATETKLESPAVALEPKVALAKEIIALPIISFVVSGLTIVISLFVQSSLVLLIFALLSLILGLVSIGVNIKKAKKVLSLIALPLSIGALVVASSLGVYHAIGKRISQLVPYGYETNFGQGFSKETDGELAAYVDVDAPFLWTEEKFRSLAFEDYSHHVIGATIEEVVATYGKANEASYEGNDLDLSYSGETDDQYVNLSFWQDEFGDWILGNGIMLQGERDLELSSAKSYSSTWIDEDFEKLIVADYDRPELGSNWEDIQQRFGNPTSGEYFLSNHGEGFFTALNVSYTDVSAGADKLSKVVLYFTEKNGSLYLTYKQAE